MDAISEQEGRAVDTGLARNIRKQTERFKILVVLDSTSASARVLDYLGRFLARRRGVQLCLISLEPKAPAAMLETGGSEVPAREELIERAMRREQDKWIAHQDDASDRVVRRAEDALHQFGFSMRAMTVCANSPLDNRDAVDRLLIAAAEHDCQTIVVGHAAHAWYKDITGAHLAEQLVRSCEGRAIWVVD